MNPRHSCQRFAAMFLLSCVGPAIAQTDPLPVVTAATEAHRKSIMVALDTVAAVVNAEATWGGITPDAARQQLSSVDGYRERMNGGLVAADVVMSSQPLLEAESIGRINAAWGAFGTAVRDLQSWRTEIRPLLREYATNVAMRAWRQAQLPQDLAPTLDMLQAVRTMDISMRVEPDYQTLDNVIELMTISQRFLEAFAADEMGSLSNASNALLSGRTGRPAQLALPPEVEQWRRRFVDKVAAQLIAAREKANALVVAGAPSADLLPAASTIESLEAKARALEDQRFGRGYVDQNAQNFVRTYARMLAAMEQNDWPQARQIMGELKMTSSRLSSPALKMVVKKREEIEKWEAAAEEARRAKAEENIRQRVAAISDKASAAKLADELHVEANSMSGRERNDLPALEQRLREIVAIWNAEVVPPISYQTWMDGQSGHTWGEAIDALRKRAIRESLAGRLEVPELLQPPLSTQPPATAVRQFCRGLFTKSEFARLHSILTASMGAFPGDRMGAESEEIRGLKTFLTAQNLERAEQFSEAIMAYREVLACIGEFVPVDAAAERLRSLKKEHPEIFTTISPLRPRVDYGR